MKNASLLDHDTALTAGNEEPGMELLAGFLPQPAPLSDRAIRITDITVEESAPVEVKIRQSLANVEWQRI